MIKYHGTPVTPIDIFLSALKDKNALVSFAHPADINRSFENCNNVILDNGAFSMWTKRKAVNWDKYYQWVEKHNNREFYFIPDVIDGSEKENDSLLRDNPFNDGVPIWHISESFRRLERLASDYNLIAFGSSGEYSELGTQKWHDRMNEAMHLLCDKEGKPQVRIHMLRCLNPKIFTKYPFYSGDSTNLARNHHRDGWQRILERIERYNSPDRYRFRRILKQGSLF